MSAEAIKAKSALVEEIAAKLKGAQSAVVVEYRGLSVAEVTELRRNLRAEDVEFKVYKNSLVRRATEATDYEGLNAQLTGPNAIAFGNSDAVAPARVLAKFAKDHEALVIKAAVVEGKLLNVEEVKEISSLPNREGMYSMLLGMLQAPVSKFARVVKAVAEAKESGSTAEAAPVEEAANETPVVEATEETKEETAE
ncbi:50S ribosomal protein L10 [Thomasclavelia cocleata]|jgi:large subunit ribosomal protein L10|uniref:Large ribosomal subunit protein uL10 n=1 Tax=Thomasclavelia cocleata TaxID=69824 RepID=A0A829ZBX1_9FIRM|nr:50S ribosomal protein L10 [Thomasclavelia cocleata]MCI9131031.1 50S ribosomal protein L10 [Thomasclavelia cocleata]MCI9629706.1 50S ribosomal protein L10 [Thomasclavelia cocleata]GFI41415.1 50S ribosomal protein L10 [Thomasclavelia cocleata]